MKPAHLHLTLAMLKLYSEECRQLARQVWGQLMLAGASGCHLLPCCLGAVHCRSRWCKQCLSGTTDMHATW